MTSSCNTKMAAKEHLQCSYLRNQRFDRRYFSAYYPILITTYHLDHVICIKIDDVVMQYQDGRQRTPQETSVRSQETSVSPQETSVGHHCSENLSKISGYLKTPQ